MNDTKGPPQLQQVNESRLARDIAAQPHSLDAVLRQQNGPGLATMLRAAATLRSATRVVITGMGASMFAGIPLEYALCAQGVDAAVIERPSSCTTATGLSGCGPDSDFQIRGVRGDR